MAEPIGSFSGLASGIQWRDMVDQIMKLEESRQLAPITRQISEGETRAEAWKSYGTTVAKLNDAAKALRDGTAFGAVKLTVPNSPTTSRTLLTASSSAAAMPGSYQVEVESLARAERLGGAYFADASAPLGFAGEFRVNGRAVTVAASDSLNAIRDKINAANAGSNASRVSASVLTVSGKSRLVLTSDVTGDAGVELNEIRAGAASPRVLKELGLVDDSWQDNVAADGALQSARVSSLSIAAYQALGVQTWPEPASIVVNGQAIAVDLSSDSIADIVVKINAKAPGAASTETVTQGGATSHRLRIAGAVSSNDDAGARMLEGLGLRERGRGETVQTVRTGNVLTAGAGGGAADGSALLTDLGLGGVRADVRPGDSFTIAGVTRDGTSVRSTVAVGAGTTLADLAAAITSAFGGSTKVATSIEGGRIVVREQAAGESLLAVSITASLSEGKSLDLGAPTAEPGVRRTLVDGTDAKVRIDGATVTRPTNTLTEAIGGVTLALQQAEAGTTIQIDVARDQDAAVKAVQDFAKAFNDMIAFVQKETQTTGRLPFNGALRASAAALKNELLRDVAGLPAGAAWGRAGAVGVALNKSGVLEVDAAKLKAALSDNLSAVQALFASAGRVSGGSFEHVASGAKSQPGSYAVSITQAATRATLLASAPMAAPFADGGTPATMALTDSVSGKTRSITLANGDTADAIASKLNTLFTSERMRLVAEVEAGALRLSQRDYGTSPSFTIAYAGGAGDAATQVGLAAGPVANGVDVAGTIGGVAATGAGQVLTGAAGGPAEGLALRYRGTVDTASTTYDFALGLGGTMARLAERVSGSGGFATTQADAGQATLEALRKRSDDVQARLDRRRDSLVKQFTAMEEALSKITAQGNWLASQVKALQPARD